MYVCMYVFTTPQHKLDEYLTEFNRLKFRVFHSP